MSEFKGTPGPWEVKPEEVDKPYIRIRGTQLGGRFKVANVLTPVYEGVPVREANETRANAHLIAAAPELLEALQLCEEFMSLLPSTGFDGLARIEGARAAIAKALGESK